MCGTFTWNKEQNLEIFKGVITDNNGQSRIVRHRLMKSIVEAGYNLTAAK